MGRTTLKQRSVIIFTALALLENRLVHMHIPGKSLYRKSSLCHCSVAEVVDWIFKLEFFFFWWPSTIKPFFISSMGALKYSFSA